MYRRSNPLLREIIESRKAREAELEAERVRRSQIAHKARMGHFRVWIRENDLLTEEEKRKIIRSSFG